jgi:hypothetical protein
MDPFDCILIGSGSSIDGGKFLLLFAVISYLLYFVLLGFLCMRMRCKAFYQSRDPYRTLYIYGEKVK